MEEISETIKTKAVEVYSVMVETPPGASALEVVLETIRISLKTLMEVACSEEAVDLETTILKQQVVWAKEIQALELVVCK